MNAPLILTLALDATSDAFFDQLRQQHFPPERNYLRAHLTLFHHLPGAQLAAIAAHLATRTQHQASLPLAVTGLQFLGRGVAYTLANAELQRLHRSLQTEWLPGLTPQDQQQLRPHVTVQNKVDPAVARALHQELSLDFEPFTAIGTGLAIWAYRNGPWEAVQTFPFVGQ